MATNTLKKLIICTLLFGCQTLITAENNSEKLQKSKSSCLTKKNIPKGTKKRGRPTKKAPEQKRHSFRKVMGKFKSLYELGIVTCEIPKYTASCTKCSYSAETEYQSLAKTLISRHFSKKHPTESFDGPSEYIKVPQYVAQSTAPCPCCKNQLVSTERINGIYQRLTEHIKRKHQDFDINILEDHVKKKCTIQLVENYHLEDPTEGITDITPQKQDAPPNFNVDDFLNLRYIEEQ